MEHRTDVNGCYLAVLCKSLMLLGAQVFPTASLCTEGVK